MKPEASSWQPITTAPKDGTLVLLYRGVLCYGYFFRSERDGSHGWITAKIGRNGDDFPSIDPPTHWMPLPLLPSEAQPVVGPRKVPDDAPSWIPRCVCGTAVLNDGDSCSLCEPLSFGEAQRGDTPQA